MKAVVDIYLKQGVLDPQGKAVHHALHSLGFDEVTDVRVGKQIVLRLDEKDADKAAERVKEMCETLLANTVIEDYKIEIVK